MLKPILYFSTLRYLKFSQIYFRLVRKLVTPMVSDKFGGSLLKRPDMWIHIPIYEDKINKQLRTCFLNQHKYLDLPSDWNNENISKLWVYNLHYFEDLLSSHADGKNNLHIQLLNNWADDNPVGYGNGWEPYPTSLRIVNVLKAWLGGLELDTKLLKNVHSQASYLSNDLERHLLGNHYFVNLKALFFAGIIFKNSRWFELARQGLLTEIPEQILPDGANFELSPMYHSLFLVDMLDMYNLSRAYPSDSSNELVSLLKAYIPMMLRFMEEMAHPDGGVSFFNDSVNGIAPKKIKIENYAEKLGFDIKPLDLTKCSIVDNATSGYISVTSAGNKLIFDAAPVGPDYIPGHAHADTLSFELSIGVQRVFVNSGISEYGLSSKRFDQRKTASHNTVEVNGKSSTQVWSSFRVANRAKIVLRESELKDDRSIVLRASHDGFKSIFGGCIHTRQLTLRDDCLVVSDFLQGRFRYAKSRFYFHPDLVITLVSNLLRVEGPDLILHCDLTGKLASLVNSAWYPEFGLELPNKVLEVQFEKPQIELYFTWSKR